MEQKNEQKQKQILQTKEKNKYIALYDHNQKLANKTATLSPGSYNLAVDQMEQIDIIKQLNDDDINERAKKIRQQHHSIMSDQISEFLINNRLFWEKITQVMNDIRSITNAMKTTVEK
jgi:hypothetical protein